MTPQTKNTLLVNTAAIIMLIGLSAFFAAFWNSMGQGIRLVLTLGLGMLLHMLAMMAWKPDTDQPVTSLPGKWIFFAAAIMETIGWFALLRSVAPQTAQSNVGSMLVMLIMAAQETAVYLKYRQNIVMFYVLAFVYGFALSLLHLLGGDARIVVATLGLSMLFLCHGLHATRFKTLTPVWAILGTALFFTSLFKLTHGSFSEILYIAAIIIGYRAALRMRSFALLWSCAFFAVAYLSYATSVYLLLGPLWSVSLVIWGIMIFACVTATAHAQKRYFFSSM